MRGQYWGTDDITCSTWGEWWIGLQVGGDGDKALVSVLLFSDRNLSLLRKTNNLFW